MKILETQKSGFRKFIEGGNSMFKLKSMLIWVPVYIAIFFFEASPILAVVPFLLHLIEKVSKNAFKHALILYLFIGISFTYFSPVLQGKLLNMADITHHKGMSKEVTDFREATGEEALWTNSMFSGMPAYQISTRSNGNLIQYVAKALSLGIPRPANLLFLYLLGFYLLLLSLKIDYRL